MKKIDRVIKKLSDLYEFNRKIKAYELREKGKDQQVAKADRQPSAMTGKLGDRAA